MEKEKYYSPEEAAEFLGVTTETIRRWIRRGELEGIKYGRLWRISESVLKKQPAPEQRA